MKFSEFLKERLFSILASFAAAGFAAVLFYVLGSGVYAGAFVAAIILLGQWAALLLEYFPKRAWYGGMLRGMEKLDKKFLLSEMLEEPSFPEGKLFCEALRAANKSMNDEIAGYRRASQEYREYIETWVHEVKTPIASSLLIIENNKNEVTADLMEEISKIESYVDQALFYSRSNTVEKDYMIRKTTLRELVSSALRKNSRIMIEGKVGLETSALDKIVYTDVKWTDFILGQILENSVKYRSASPKIEIYGMQNENGVTLVVSDNGIGIPEKDRGRVFEKGFTGTNGRTGAKSTGIGLYLCKKLCDKLSLGLSVASSEGRGTMVFIVFPKSNMYL
jgi:signal transduction histidine kinase